MSLMVYPFTFLLLKCLQVPRIQVNEVLHSFNVPAPICTTFLQTDNTIPLSLKLYFSSTTTQSRPVFGPILLLNNRGTSAG